MLKKKKVSIRSLTKEFALNGHSSGRSFFSSLFSCFKSKNTNTAAAARAGINVAVNNLNLDIYEGQITVLLGHNVGSRKNTETKQQTNKQQRQNVRLSNE
jgi:ABC-type proline/glycine betaine transport system ATPase subunit